VPQLPLGLRRQIPDVLFTLEAEDEISLPSELAMAIAKALMAKSSSATGMCPARGLVPISKDKIRNPWHDYVFDTMRVLIRRITMVPRGV